jgi:hypothetical protein
VKKLINKIAKTNHTKIPLILFIINSFSSFIPIIQILLAYFVGATFYPFKIIDNESETTTLIIASLILGFILLFLFYWTNKKSLILIFSILFISYMNFGAMLWTENKEEMQNNYMLFYQVLSIATTGTLYLTGKIKEKFNK